MTTMQWQLPPSQCCSPRVVASLTMLPCSHPSRCHAPCKVALLASLASLHPRSSWLSSHQLHPASITFHSDLSPPLLKLPTAIGDPSPPIACRSQSNKNTETSTLPPKRNFRWLPALFLPPNCRHFHPQPSILAVSFTTQNPSLNQASFLTKQVLLKSTTLKNNPGKFSPPSPT
jgi:hypothetical protein